MKKYELKKGTKELKKEDLHQMKGLCVDSEETLASFESKEDALKALKSYKTSIFETGNAVNYFCVEQYFIEENEYDDDSEWIDGGDVLSYTDIKITLYVDYEEVSSFNNYAEAKAAFDALDDAPEYEDAESDEGFKYVKVYLKPFETKELWVKK